MHLGTTLEMDINGPKNPVSGASKNQIKPTLNRSMRFNEDGIDHVFPGVPVISLSVPCLVFVPFSGAIRKTELGGCHMHRSACRKHS